MDPITDPSRQHVWHNATRTRCISLAAVVAYDYLSAAEICRIRDERTAAQGTTDVGRLDAHLWQQDARLGSKLQLHLTGSQLALRGAEADEVYQLLNA